MCYELGAFCVSFYLDLVGGYICWVYVDVCSISTRNATNFWIFFFQCLFDSIKHHSTYICDKINKKNTVLLGGWLNDRKSVDEHADWFLGVFHSQPTTLFDISSVKSFKIGLFFSNYMASVYRFYIQNK